MTVVRNAIIYGSTDQYIYLERQIKNKINNKYSRYETEIKLFESIVEQYEELSIN